MSLHTTTSIVGFLYSHILCCLYFFNLASMHSRSAGLFLPVPERGSWENPNKENGDTAPRIYAWKPSCPPALFSLALKISQVFVPQVWSITLILLESISPNSAPKIRRKIELSKFLEYFFAHLIVLFASREKSLTWRCRVWRCNLTFGKTQINLTFGQFCRDSAE